MKCKDEYFQDELQPEYDFDYSKAVRGKYFKRLMEEAANVVVLEPDLADVLHVSGSSEFDE